MVEKGNPNSVSDAGVGALALHACVHGSWLNVKINSANLGSDPEVKKILEEGIAIAERSDRWRSEILAKVNSTIGQ